MNNGKNSCMTNLGSYWSDNTNNISFSTQAQDYSRQLEEKLRAREVEIQRLRDQTKHMLRGTNDEGSSRSRQSRISEYCNMDVDELRQQLQTKEQEIDVSNQWLHSVEISGFFYHSDFTWNQVQKLCTIFEGSETAKNGPFELLKP